MQSSGGQYAIELQRHCDPGERQALSWEARVRRYFVLSFVFAMVAAMMFGCGTTYRTLSATSWLEPPGSTAAAAPAGSAAASPAAGGLKSQYYMTYWEGSCGWFGCGRGDTHVKRCKVNADNTVTCLEEANASKAFNPE
jgi:hypothetical protein